MEFNIGIITENENQLLLLNKMYLYHKKHTKPRWDSQWRQWQYKSFQDWTTKPIQEWDIEKLPKLKGLIFPDNSFRCAKGEIWEDMIGIINPQVKWWKASQQQIDFWNSDYSVYLTYPYPNFNFLTIVQCRK